MAGRLTALGEDAGAIGRFTSIVPVFLPICFG
jgi:hypothetical protein